MGKAGRIGLALGLVVAAGAVVGPEPGPAEVARGPLPLTGDLAVHDPGLLVTEHGWYVFGTGDGRVGDGTIPIFTSPDGLHWTKVGTVWDAKPGWLVEEVPRVDNLWAPEVYHDPDTGHYYLYYAASAFGSQRSVIGLATNVALDPADPGYEWVDQGKVWQSRGGDAYNAIDPAVIADASGTRWLVFGSFWGGIHLVELDWPSGKPVPGAPLHQLASRQQRGYNAIEAPLIVARDGWFYLFVSFDTCCRGTGSTYRIAVGRSAQITGPYLDRDGVPMLTGGGTVLLARRGEDVAAGGQSYSDGYLAYHTYGPYGTPGDFRLAIEPVVWAPDVWPELSPDPR